MAKHKPFGDIDNLRAIDMLEAAKANEAVISIIGRKNDGTPVFAVVAGVGPDAAELAALVDRLGAGAEDNA